MSFSAETPSPPAFSRRQVLAGAGLTVLATAVPRAAYAAAETAPDGFRLLRARPGNVPLRGADQPATAIWGYDGVVPGPLLRAKRGDELKVRLINELPQATSVHWHGLRLPNAMDGAAHLTQKPVEPGASFDYRFVLPDAGTFWYHAHLHSSEQVARGLYGLLIVDEPEPPAVDQDIALVFDDWRLNPDGSIHASFGAMHDAAHEGRTGQHLTVNSRPALDIPVKANERVRLRLLNAANARLLAVRIDGHQPIVMAIDGQPAEPFPARDARVVLGPANRIDLFVDMRMAPGSNATIFLDTDRASLPIARLIYAADAPVRAEPLGTPKPLPANPLPQRMDFAGALKLNLPLDGGAMRMHMRPPGGGRGRDGDSGDPRTRIWTIAGQASSGHHGAPLFSVKRGRTVMLAFPNRTAFPHSMHVHGHHFRLLDALDDGWKPFWLDTLVVMADQTARIAFVADNPGKWMLHCHMLEHQESGMAAWFEVT